ncbi:MAG: glycosyltransferase family 2 protein [Candidatus Pacearchaeota archaeon]|nr:glycosyltransferase family 2 protein [Candidatus Pacearchaeota archaeon]
MKNKLIEQPLVDIYMLHVNGDIIKKSLASLSSTNYANYNILVFLNGTTDDSEELIKNFNVKIFRSKKNLGFTGGHNQLFNYSRKNTNPKYIVVVNDDMEFDKNWLSELVNFAEKNNASICSSKIRNFFDKDKFDYGGAGGGFIDKYGYAFCRGRIFDSIEKDKGQYNSPGRVFYASGGAMLVRTDLIKQIGFFDNDYFIYCEEVDFCWRANLYGEEVFYVPSSVVYHLGHYTIKKEKMMPFKEYLIHRNHMVTFIKNYSAPYILKLIIPRLLLELFSAIAFPRKLLAITKSFLYIIYNWSRIKQKREKIQALRKVPDKELKNWIYQKSIAMQYFVFKKKRFNELNFKIPA